MALYLDTLIKNNFRCGVNLSFVVYDLSKQTNKQTRSNQNLVAKKENVRTEQTSAKDLM